MNGGRFLRWSSLALAMLLPYASNLTWEYVEMKRLASRVAEIRSSAPTASSSRRIGADVVGNLFFLSTAVGRHTLECARRGDADAAMDSLYAEARLNRLLQEGAPQGIGFPWRLAAHLVEALERTRPDAVHLTRLADALADLDTDRGLRQFFVAHRDGLIDASAPGGGWAWELHRRIRLIDADTELIAAAGRPWPARIDAIDVMAERRARAWRLMQHPTDLMNIAVTLVEGDALNLAVVRSARSVIAVERYRREHGEEAPAAFGDLVPDYLAALPVDPFSGEALKFSRRGDGYLVYSVGPDRQDAGGQLPAEWPRSSEEAADARDLGLLVRNQAPRVRSSIDHRPSASRPIIPACSSPPSSPPPEEARALAHPRRSRC